MPLRNASVRRNVSLFFFGLPLSTSIFMVLSCSFCADRYSSMAAMSLMSLGLFSLFLKARMLPRVSH